MKIKITLPINLEMSLNATGSTMVGQDYPISVDGKNVGMGKVFKVEGFSIFIELDSDAEKFHKEHFTEEELKEFCV